MPLVVDASITLAWAFEDEAGPYSLTVLDWLRGDQAVVPGIWPLEVANALVVGQRRGRLTVAQEEQFLTLLRSLHLVVVPVGLDRTLGPVLNLARSQNLSAYDAAYLDLAVRDDLPLATQDNRLRDAAARLGVSLAP